MTSLREVVDIPTSFKDHLKKMKLAEKSYNRDIDTTDDSDYEPFQEEKEEDGKKKKKQKDEHNLEITVFFSLL